MKIRLSKLLYRSLPIFFAVIIVVSVVGISLVLNDRAQKSDYAESQIGVVERHPNYAGVLSIPSVGVNLPCIETLVSDYELSQLAIDREFCGVKMLYFGTIPEDYDCKFGKDMWIIGDHDYQGFDVIMKCKPDDLVFFTHSDGIQQTLRVVHTHEGAELEGEMVDCSGTQFIITEDYDLVLMTCFPLGNLPFESEDRRFFVCLELVEE